MSPDERLTQIINYVAAISREVGEFRQEFREFRAETNARFERLEARLDGVESRVGSIESRVSSVDSRTDRIDSRLGRLESKVDKGFEETRDDIRRLKHAMEVYTEDAMELRVEQRHVRKRVEALERGEGLS
jgi:predicted  nucleic acid-binding Zn-ribbon protein